jgi:para-nitrobenzyl esterase
MARCDSIETHGGFTITRNCTITAAALLAGVATTMMAFAADHVKTENGIVEGITVKNAAVRTFRGIPYGAPPAGDLRWRPPQPARKWDGVRKADQFAPRCMQAPIYADMLFRSNGVSEDCLYLNVWTPAKSPNDRLPVLVYIYGGGFQAGDSSEGRYDGESLAGRGIVFVSMNYRLGVFGFFSHPELSKESGHNASGNYGLMDQAAALLWVRRNIAAFGGDPDKITIGGESAGSFSVSALMASPMSRDLIAGAIGESGAMLGPTLPARALAKTEEDGKKFAENLGAPAIAPLRAMAAEKLLDAAPKAGPMRFVPNVDGYFLPESPLATYGAGKQSRIPLLAGWNSDEGTPQVLTAKEKPTAGNFRSQLEKVFGDQAEKALKVYPAASDAGALESAKALAGDQFIAYSTWKWIEMQKKTGEKPVYRYYFTRARPPKPGTTMSGVPASMFGATHSSEIEYALGNLDFNDVYMWTAEDRMVSDLMQRYWVNFVKKGDPNSAGLPNWPPNGGKNEVMRIDVNARAAPAGDQARYEFLDGFFSKQSN